MGYCITEISLALFHLHSPPKKATQKPKVQITALSLLNEAINRRMTELELPLQHFALYCAINRFFSTKPENFNSFLFP